MTYGMGATAIERARAAQIAIPSYRTPVSRSFPSRYRIGSLGATSKDSIKVGQLAQQDPIVAFASVMASNLLRQASTIPAGKRFKWLRDELNKVQPGLGDTFASKTRELRRRGRSNDQGVFDGLRLSLANHIAQGMEKRAGEEPMGLGADSTRVRNAFCGIVGIGGATGASVAAFKNPSASPAVGNATSQALESMGCNQGALEQQARIAEANAAAAQANAAAAAAAGQGGEDKTLMYVAIGGGVLLLGVLGVIALK